MHINMERSIFLLFACMSRFMDCFNRIQRTHHHPPVGHTSNFSKHAIKLLCVEDEKPDGITDDVPLHWHKIVIVDHGKHLGNVGCQP